MTQHEAISLLQITDTHLGGEVGTVLQGLDTDYSLAGVLADVADRQTHYDVLIASGDLALNGEAEAYARFAQLSNGVAERSLWIPGNHDCRATMLQEHEALMPFQQDVGNWRIVLLDSAVPGRVGGYVSDEQIQRLSAAVAELGERHLLLVSHHPLIDIDSAWIDPHRVANAERVLACLATVQGSMLALCGHIHQEQDQLISVAGKPLRFLSTPSTCIQFTPGSEHYALDCLNPGYREIQLHADGSIATQVHRIAGDYPVDTASRGY